MSKKIKDLNKNDLQKINDEISKKDITFNLNKIIMNDNKYLNYKKKLTEEIKNNIEKRKDWVIIEIEDNCYNMNKGNFLTLLILVNPFNEYKKEFPEKLFFDPSDIGYYEKYFDEIIDYFIDEFDIKINKSLVKIIDELTFVSSEVNLKYGSTISLKSIIDIEKRNERFRELLHIKINKEDNLEPDEIMNITNESLKELIKIITEDKEYNDLKNYINSDAGINKKQLGQVLSYIALKPDFNENIIPTPINTSFARGLNTIEEFYINAVGARKALITAHKEVKKSGYLNRKLSLLTIDEKINDIEDCETSQLMELTINNNNILKLLRNRWFLNEKEDVYELITEDRNDLIGKTVKLRSPITCACKNGICKTCYGELYKINKNTNIGMVATLLLTSPLTQRLLSSKHLLQAIIESIDWGTKIIKYFEIANNQLVPKEKFDIEIHKDNILESEEENEVIIDGFTIIDKNNEIEIESPVNLIINKEIIEDNNIFNENKNYYTLNDKILKEYDYIFSYLVENNGLSNSLFKIKDLLERNKYISEHNIFDFYKYFTSLIDESGIFINLVHIEVIIKQMLYFINNNREELKEKFPDYKIYNISDSIQYGSKSIGKTLAFEYIYKQLTTDCFDSLNKKENSLIDLLYN